MSEKAAHPNLIDKKKLQYFLFVLRITSPPPFAGNFYDITGSPTRMLSQATCCCSRNHEHVAILIKVPITIAPHMGTPQLRVDYREISVGRGAEALNLDNGNLDLHLIRLVLPEAADLTFSR